MSEIHVKNVLMKSIYSKLQAVEKIQACFKMIIVDTLI